MTDNVLPFQRPNQPTQREVLLALINTRHAAIKNHRMTAAVHLCKSQLQRFITIMDDRAFMTHRIEQARADIAALDTSLDELRSHRRRIASYLPDLFRAADTWLTFEQKCDAINVNQADRRDLAPDISMMDLVFLHALEDSASRRRQDFKDAPLFNIAMLVFHDFLMTQEGKAVVDAEFGVGGMFQWLPTYAEQPDGTMKRNPPPLRLAMDSDAEQPPAA